ncbi:MAG: metallopeptidase family protein [Candidatus Saccharimonadales bacterium]
MIDVSDDIFQDLIASAIDEIPERYANAMKNVGITWDTEPTPDQRIKLQLRGDQSLFGLYEGIPLTKRGMNYNLVLPDKITIFKLPIESVCQSINDLKKQIKHTLWHELAHHFGLNHEEIDKLDKKH